MGKSVSCNEFALLTFAGLAEVSLQEVAERKDITYQVDRLPNYDLVRCSFVPEDIFRLEKLRTVEDVFWLIANPQRVTVKKDLGKLDKLVCRRSLLKGLELKNRLFRPKKPKQPTFNCFIKQDCDRLVYRKEIANRLNSVVSANFPKWKNSDPAAIEIWGFYIDQKLHLGFRLSDNRMRYRAQKPVSRKAALRPTIAAALMRAASPRYGERVLDPMCGTGTILSEGIALNTGAVFIGGDSDRQAIKLAKESLSRTNVSLQQWDATRLPVNSSTIDCIVCNLPFGQQFSTQKDNQDLYPMLIDNWMVGLKAKGRMVLLTADSTTLENSFQRQNLRWQVVWKVKVLGVWANAYQIFKN